MTNKLKTKALAALLAGLMLLVLGSWTPASADTKTVEVATVDELIAAIARGKEEEIRPLKGIEDIMVKDPDKSGWAAFCGRYEPDPDDDENIDEVFLKDGDLWAWIVTDMGTRYALKLWPLGDDTFSFREDDTEVIFGEDCFTVDDEVFKKISQ